MCAVLIHTWDMARMQVCVCEFFFVCSTVKKILSRCLPIKFILNTILGISYRSSWDYLIFSPSMRILAVQNVGSRDILCVPACCDFLLSAICQDPASDDKERTRTKSNLRSSAWFEVSVSSWMQFFLIHIFRFTRDTRQFRDSCDKCKHQARHSSWRNPTLMVYNLSNDNSFVLTEFTDITYAY